MLDTATEPVTPMQLVRVIREINPMFAEAERGVCKQQDADECLSLLLNNIHDTLKTPGDKTDIFSKVLIDELLGIEMQVSMKNVEEPSEIKTKKETLYKLICYIDNSTLELVEGLKKSLKENVDLFSDKLQRNTVFEKSQLINRLPNYLSVQFMRFFWKKANTLTGAKAGKSKILKSVIFSKIIDLYDMCTEETKELLNLGRKIESKLMKDDKDFKIENVKKEENKNNEGTQGFVVISDDKEKAEDTKKTKKPLKSSFPNFRKYEDKIDDIVKLEEDSLMADALNEYFLKLKKVVKAEKIVKRFSKDEIDSILIELENHILFKLYDKLYPLKSTKLDDEFYKKCCRLEFIKPENIITDKNIYNERLWQFSMDYLNEINNKYTPQDKLKVVLKSFGILQNSITFCSGKKELGVDDTIKPLIYVLIKSKPKTIFTNYNYCQLFLNDNLCKTQYGILLTQLYMIMNIIKDMKHTDLIGVTEEQFGKDE
jgi:hypothetical protein